MSRIYITYEEVRNRGDWVCPVHHPDTGGGTPGGGRNTALDVVGDNRVFDVGQLPGQVGLGRGYLSG